MPHSESKKPVDTDADANEGATTKPDAADDSADATKPNPPRTTSGGWFTAPKFGSAGSGGAELEPGPERD
jgi:hypothetical protein